MRHIDWITLNRWRIDCIIGLLPRERTTTQPLEVRLRLGIDLWGAGERDDLAASVDYAAICDQVSFLATEGDFRLLETMAVAIARLVLAPPEPGEARGAVQTVEIALEKPDVLGGRAVPGIAVAWDATALPLARAVGPGDVDHEVLCETDTTTAARVRLPPGATLQLPARAAVYVLVGAVDTDRGPLVPGQRHRRGVPHKIVNTSTATATLLTVWSPGGAPHYLETP